MNKPNKPNKPSYDKDKICIMAKMAVYDKRHFEKDAKANHYFRHDYIYKQNMRMRFFLGIGCFVLIVFYILFIVEIQGEDVFELNFLALGLRLLGFILIVMTSYSFIGTIIYTREFVLSNRRINKYFELMHKLRDDADINEDDEDDEDDEYLRKVEPYKPRRGYLYRYSDEIEKAELEKELDKEEQEEMERLARLRRSGPQREPERKKR